MQKQIGGPGYTGDYIIVVYPSGRKVAIEQPSDEQTVIDIQQDYPVSTKITGWAKPKPFESPIQTAYVQVF